MTEDQLKAVEAVVIASERLYALERAFGPYAFSSNPVNYRQVRDLVVPLMVEARKALDRAEQALVDLVAVEEPVHE